MAVHQSAIGFAQYITSKFIAVHVVTYTHTIVTQWAYEPHGRSSMLQQLEACSTLPCIPDYVHA